MLVCLVCSPKCQEIIARPFSLCRPVRPVRADTVGAQAESSNTWSPLTQSALISLAWGRRAAVQPDKESILILCRAAAGKKSAPKVRLEVNLCDMKVTANGHELSCVLALLR